MASKSGSMARSFSAILAWYVETSGKTSGRSYAQSLALGLSLRNRSPGVGDPCYNLVLSKGLIWTTPAGLTQRLDELILQLDLCACMTLGLYYFT